MTRFKPAGLMCVGLLVGYFGVFGPQLPGHRSRPAFVAYRGPHRVGDMIGPNARVVGINRDGDPTAVVSTDGRPPVVWAFELAEPSTLGPMRGRRVRAFGPDPWLHPACPSVMCPRSAHSASARVPTPPPPLAVNLCPALRPSDLVALLGPGRGTYSASAPSAGTCVWDNGTAGVEIEVGGSDWWAYLVGLHGFYRADATSPDRLVSDRDGLHVAIRHGHVTAVLLTYTNKSVPSWVRIASEVATWVASH